jgi:hypothetical protein
MPIVPSDKNAAIKGACGRSLSSQFFFEWGGTGGQQVLRFFQGGASCLARDCGKRLQEIFQRVFVLQIIEKALHGLERPAKNRGSAENVGIFDDHLHGLALSRVAQHSAASEVRAHNRQWLCHDARITR